MLLLGSAGLARPKTFTFIFDVAELEAELRPGKEISIGNYTIRGTSHDYKLTQYGNIIVKRSKSLDQVMLYVLKEIGGSGTFTVRDRT